MIDAIPEVKLDSARRLLKAVAAERDEARAERDALRAELDAVYPKLVEALHAIDGTSRPTVKEARAARVAIREALGAMK